MQDNKSSGYRILGIDPGTQVTGIGIIDIVEKGRIQLCIYDAIRTKRTNPLALRLKEIFEGIDYFIEKYEPNFVAIEDIFYSENVKTAIVMGQARGVSMLAPALKNIDIAEYSPREVKLAVVGNGGASKNQVQYMVKNILNLKEEIHPADAADALAVAICHHHRAKKY
ncbi:MAG: crossover junction endodeoxyribonuclease RuvC [Calditrichia bacterium]|nr:crossover junction endodeoxyribonuclease RuvC [Calditrichia bacterium]